MYIRVISGTARGAKLFSPDGVKTRPTSDFVKESLFNILGNDLADSSFLDLFAGSGAIGIEALSRGGSCAVFVDASAASAALIRRNLEKTRLVSNARVVCADYKKALRGLEGQNFDIVFIDPPYDRALTESAIEAVVSSGVLAEGGIVVAEMAKGDAVSEDFAVSVGLAIYKQRQYSGTELIFLK